MTQPPEQPEPHILSESSSPPSGSSELAQELLESSAGYMPSTASSESASLSDDAIDVSSPQKEPKYIVFDSCLQELMRFCSRCGSPVVNSTRVMTGSMVTFHLECHQGHAVVWRSQPRTKKAPLGNFLLAAATLLAGLSFSRLADWAKSMNLSFIGLSTFQKLQKDCLWPVTQEAWDQERQEAVVKGSQDIKDLAVAGDCKGTMRTMVHIH